MTPDEIVKALRCEHGHLTNHGRDFMLNYTREEFFKILNESADLIESLQARIAELEAQLANARNELCQRCGRYHEAHKGACDGCKWKELQNVLSH